MRTGPREKLTKIAAEKQTRREKRVKGQLAIHRASMYWIEDRETKT